MVTMVPSVTMLHKESDGKHVEEVCDVEAKNPNVENRSHPFWTRCNLQRWSQTFMTYGPSSRDQLRCAWAKPFVRCCALRECSSGVGALVDPGQLDADHPVRAIAGTSQPSLPAHQAGTIFVATPTPPSPSCKSLGQRDAKRVPREPTCPVT